MTTTAAASGTGTGQVDALVDRLLEENDPADAIAQCKDGMYSHAANRRGACSRHGGVAKFLKP